MQLTERHFIKPTHPLHDECDRLCFASKNIFNRANYIVRTEYEDKGTYTALSDLYGAMKGEECMAQLPPKVAQQTLRSLKSAWESYFKLLKAKREGRLPEGQKVNVPKYLPKEDGRHVATYSYQAVSKKVFDKARKVKLSQCAVEVPTKVERFADIACVRIVPKVYGYVVEVVYNVEDVEPLKSNRTYAAIDLGVNNLATITFSKRDEQPLIVNGRPLKSVNQYYNKRLAYLRSRLPNGKRTSKRIKRLTAKRNAKVDDYMHKASKAIVREVQRLGANKVIVGHNEGWKQEAGMGHVNNQSFVSIPHSRFVAQLRYKCERAGITLVTVEESYTSQASFLDLDPMPVYGEEGAAEVAFSGYRECRGLYKRKGVKERINADVNGSYNIMRKAIPTVFAKGVEGVVVRPRRLSIR